MAARSRGVRSATDLAALRRKTRLGAVLISLHHVVASCRRIMSLNRVVAPRNHRPVAGALQGLRRRGFAIVRDDRAGSVAQVVRAHA